METVSKKPIRVLLLDDREDNLILRAAILRRHGYEAVTSASVEDAETHLNGIDIAVLNAAVALIVAGQAANLREGATRAGEALASGKAKEKLEALVSASNSSG